MRFILRVLVNALALWLTALILYPHVQVSSWDAAADATEWSWPLFWTYLMLALIFGVVNGIIGTAIKIVAFPLYILTLGLISLIVNGLLLLLVAWISGLIGFGLTVENFGWGVLGAIVLGVIAWLMGIVLRPFTGRR